MLARAEFKAILQNSIAFSSNLSGNIDLDGFNSCSYEVIEDRKEVKQKNKYQTNIVGKEVVVKEEEVLE